jgi:hypothetical protein
MVDTGAMSGHNDSRSMVPSPSSFPQQGQIDWGVLSANTVEYTVETLSRISRAGVEALTLHAASAIFSNARLASSGEIRLLDALKRVKTFSSGNNTLWFGFGIKSIVRSLSESQQGLICIGICATLTEEFSTRTSAKILKELFLLYNPPEELIPSLQQWQCLVESCSGIVASSDFGHILSGLTRLYLLDGKSNLCSNSEPCSIAKVLKGLFDVSCGNPQKIRIAGGLDCAWFAAVSYWLFGLSVLMEDADGNPVYRPGTTTLAAQVTIQCSGNGILRTTETLSIVNMSYCIPSGRQLVLGDRVDENSILTHGRVDWSTCLCDTFGSPMKALLTSLAHQTGSCLGSAARIYQELMCNPNPDFIHSDQTNWQLPPNKNCFGRGFYIHARNMFSELHQDPLLLATAERMLDKSAEEAVRDFTASINSVRTYCQCPICNEISISDDSSLKDEYLKRGPGKKYCCVLLVAVLIDVILLSAQVNFHQDLAVRPTFTGIERLYGAREAAGRATPRKNLELLRNPSPTPVSKTFNSLLELFTGRTHSSLTVSENSAISSEGICIYLKSLCEISSSPECLCSLWMIPGKIAWNGHLYNSVVDKDSTLEDRPEDLPWKNAGESTITDYDILTDYCSKNLKEILVIEETYDLYGKILAKWQISSSNGFVFVGPQLIANKMPILPGSVVLQLVDP